MRAVVLVAVGFLSACTVMPGVYCQMTEEERGLVRERLEARCDAR